MKTKLSEIINGAITIGAVFGAILAGLLVAGSSLTGQQFYGGRKIVYVPLNRFVEVDLRTKYTFSVFGREVFQCEATPTVLEARLLSKEGEVLGRNRFSPKE